MESLDHTTALEEENAKLKGALTEIAFLDPERSNVQDSIEIANRHIQL